MSISLLIFIAAGASAIQQPEVEVASNYIKAVAGLESPGGMAGRAGEESPVFATRLMAMAPPAGCLADDASYISRSRADRMTGRHAHNAFGRSANNLRAQDNQ